MSNLPNGGDGVIVKDQKKPTIHHSTFPLNQKHATTLKFGQVTPFAFLYCNPKDNVSLRSLHNLRTLSLKSPLMQDVRLNKDFYSVPLRALLPLTFDRIYNNPVASSVGSDDIDAELANTTVILGRRVHDARFTGFTYGYRDGLLSPLYTALQVFGPMSYGGTVVSSSNLNTFVHYLFRTLALYDAYFSSDSLFARFRMPLNKMLNCADDIKESSQVLWKFYHTLFENLADQLVTDTSAVAPLIVDYYSIPTFKAGSSTATNEVIYSRTYNLRSLEERMQMYYDFVHNPVCLHNVSWSTFETAYTKTQEAITTDVLIHNFNPDETVNPGIAAFLNPSNSNYSVLRDNRVLNIAPLLAYQMICYEYFTNDHVDNIFTAQDFRDFYRAYLDAVYFDSHSGAISQSYFKYVYNGASYSYDSFSASYLSLLLALSSEDTFAVDSTSVGMFSLYLNLITPKRSLRYMDVFTGSKVQPLAIGDVNVVVSDNKVSAIDITKSIQMQRFLNQVNRIGSKAKNYIKGLFGVDIRDRNDVPVKIGHIDEIVYSSEVQNTAEAQTTQSQSITSNLNSRGGNFAFEMSFVEPSIILALCSFEVSRFYNNGLDPFALKVDRYDMYNPYFQYTGDQSLPVACLDAEGPEDEAFGYVGRFMEYKTSVDYATGAFQDLLKSWIFRAKLPLWSPNKTDFYHISPEFIRTYETELDEYYIDSTATIPENRFQFICLFDTKISAERDMVFNPQILG